MSIRSPSPWKRGSSWAEAADGALTLLRCAGPLIMAGAGLIVVGGVLRHAWLVMMGAIIVLMAAAHALRCHVLRGRGAADPDDCCPNVPLPGPAGDPRQNKPSRKAIT